MYALRTRDTAEQWITPPAPALDRYLLRSRPRAANDNGTFLSKIFPVPQIAACLVLSSVLTLVVAFVH